MNAAGYAKAVFSDKEQHVLAGISGSFGQRLFEFNTNRFVPADIGIGADISSIYQDHSGRIWIGTQGGLVLLDGQNSKLFSEKDGLPAPDVRAIADDAEGNMWIGTGGGLACLRDGRITSFHKKDGLPSEDISSLLVDEDGVLWIGTRGSGLARALPKINGDALHRK